MISLRSLIEQPLVHRFGLTLLHFLWQGAAVALVAALVLRLLRRRRAESRYLASVVGVALMALLPAVTFSVIEVPALPAGEAAPVARGEMNALETRQTVGLEHSLLAPTAAEESGESGAILLSERGSTPSAFSPPSPTKQPAPTAAERSILVSLAWMARWADSLRPLLPWVVCAWALGVLFLSTRLAAGWLYVVGLKRHATPVVPESLGRTLGRLSTQLGISRAVTLLESTLVTVPSVVGFLRPVILLPASALTGLAPQQLESLLAHELAHVRRHDYLVNVIQCIIETVLFYHPAVWWLSGRIRAERENCCDDLAVSVVGSQLLYARALVDMASLPRRQHPLTAAADGADLASRIRRIVGLAPAAPDRLSSWWVGTVLLLTLAGGALVVSLGSAARLARAEGSEPAEGRKDPAAAVDAETGAEQPADEPPFRLFDEFDGKLKLGWEVLRPNPDHVSLTKYPGRLTIISELGGLHAGARTGLSAKNVYLVPNPAVAGGDFVVTTCLERFHPEAPYQQAGPHIYDDDDNYFKAIIARNLNGVLIGCAWESGGNFGGRNLKADDIAWDRLWLRIIKRGRAYESSYSLDGEKYTVIAERLWGDGSPQRIGLAVMNEDGSPAPLDAAFDFFEVRSLTDEEKNDPAYLERQKLHGAWEVVSARLGGEAMQESLWSRFEFQGTEVTLSEKGEHLTSKYALDPEGDPPDRYAVPDGDVAELAAFIERLSQFRPTTPEQDVEHRAKFRRALHQAAKAIVEREKDTASPMYEVAEFILLANRAHWIAQGTAREQRQMVADAKGYLVKNRDRGRAAGAADVAQSVGQALERCGQWRIAAEAYAAFAEILRESADGEMADLARTMEAKAGQLQDAAERIAPAPKGEIEPQGKMIPLDLRSKFNWRAVDFLEGKFIGAGFTELALGEQILCGVNFRIDDGMIQLGSKQLRDAPPEVNEIPVNRNVFRLYVLHAAQYGNPNNLVEGERVGEYRIHYEDGSAARMPIAFGVDLRDWWNTDQGKPTTRGRVVWTGSNACADKQLATLRLYRGVWENPHPEKKVTTVDFVSTMGTVCAPFCVAMTVEESPNHKGDP